MKGYWKLSEITRGQEIVLIDCNKQYQTKTWLYIAKGNKTVQSVIAGLETVLNAVEKWNKKSEDITGLLTHSSDGFRSGCYTDYSQLTGISSFGKLCTHSRTYFVVRKRRQWVILFRSVIFHGCFGLSLKGHCIRTVLAASAFLSWRR